jgi:hypothetical protein
MPGLAAAPRGKHSRGSRGVILRSRVEGDCRMRVAMRGVDHRLEQGKIFPSFDAGAALC